MYFRVKEMENLSSPSKLFRFPFAFQNCMKNLINSKVKKTKNGGVRKASFLRLSTVGKNVGRAWLTAASVFLSVL
jgi:hypothetical protein